MHECRNPDWGDFKTCFRHMCSTFTEKGRLRFLAAVKNGSLCSCCETITVWVILSLRKGMSNRGFCSRAFLGAVTPWMRVYPSLCLQ